MPARQRSIAAAASETFSFVPALLVLITCVAWAKVEGGYPINDWLPGALVLTVALPVCLLTIRGRWRDVPVEARVALGCLFGFALWSYASIAWAQQPGEAWDGANRSMLYVVVFALCALWSMRGDVAGALVGAWTLAIAAIGLFTLLTATADSFIAERLAEPAGYQNAAAATQMMVFWPALVLAGRAEVHWLLRGVLAGSAVAVADVALLSQSRGSIYSIPIVLAFLFVVCPGRVRTIGALLVVAPAFALTAPELLQVGEDIRNGSTIADALAPAARLVVFTTLAVTVITWIVAGFESSRTWSRDARRRARRGLAGLGMATLALGGIAALAVAGNPLTRLDNAWRSFKAGQPKTTSNTGSRLGGLGSNRYDAYRVALNTFKEHPVRGVGADNYLQDYLRDGRSDESLRYPHSLEMRTLAQTGIVGTALLLGAILAIFFAAYKAMRQAEPLGAAVAAGAITTFAYWLIHGSFDWFWEFAGLGAPAFALAGIACSLVPRGNDRTPGDPRTPRPVLRRHIPIVGTGILCGALLATFLMPLRAERDVQTAAGTWSRDLGGAYERLARADRLNPVSERAALVAGSIAVRVKDLPLAQFWFRRVLARNEGNTYAVLQLGGIASEQGRRAEATELLARARDLSPRDTVVTDALRDVRGGKRLDITAINREILERARARVE